MKIVITNVVMISFPEFKKVRSNHQKYSFFGYLKAHS